MDWMNEDQHIEENPSIIEKCKEVINCDLETREQFNNFKKEFEEADKDALLLMLFVSSIMPASIMNGLDFLEDEIEDLKSKLAFLEKDFTPIKRRLKRLDK